MSILNGLFAAAPEPKKNPLKDIPFFAPFLPSDEVLDFLDDQKNRAADMLRQGRTPDVVEQAFSQAVARAFTSPDAPFAAHAFVRQTPATVLWRNEDYGIAQQVAANLWLQPFADPHADAKLSVLTLIDPATRAMRVLLSDEMDLVLLHKRHEADSFKTLDIVQGEDRLMGAAGAIAGKMTIPAAYMAARVEVLRDELGIGFACTHARLRGRAQGVAAFTPV